MVAAPPVRAHRLAPGTIQGRVVELDALGVHGALVRVEGTSLATRTDADGAFRLDGVPLGPVVLVAEAPDYVPARVALSASERRAPVALELRFDDAAWEDAPELSSRAVVTPVRAATAGETRVTPRDIRAAPRRNAEEILRQVPGLTLVQHGSEGKGHQFFLRGFDAVHGSDFELSVEGMPLNEWSNVHAQGYLDLAMILPELVREVAVTKGPFRLEQGAFAMAGSADYRLGAPNDARGWRASYTVGTTRRHRIFAGYAPREGDSFVGLAATHDAGFGENRRLARATFNGRARLLDQQDRRLDLTALGGYGAFGLPGVLPNAEVASGRVGFYDTLDDRGEGWSARGLLALRYGWEGEGHEVSVTGYAAYRRLALVENFTGFLLDATNGDRRDQRQETWSFGAFGTHESRLTRTLAWRSGLGVRGDAFGQTEHNVGRALERVRTRRDLEGMQLLAHALGGLRWTPTEQLRFDAGARLDVLHVAVRDRLQGGERGDGTEVVVSPRVTARWAPAEGWKLLAAYGRGFRPPEARAFSTFDPGSAGITDEVFTGGAPTPTVSDAVEVGMRWQPLPAFGLGLAAFGTFIERESVFDHVSGVSLDLNGTRRLGAELLLSSEPLPWLRLGATSPMSTRASAPRARACPSLPGSPPASARRSCIRAASAPGFACSPSRRGPSPTAPPGRRC